VDRRENAARADPNRKLRTASEWVPRFASVREGWPATLAQMTAA
jgi:hypothetical protein